jgi:hypothetical protein
MLAGCRIAAPIASGVCISVAITIADPITISIPDADSLAAADYQD